jgi:hypothetical protein
MKKPPSDHAPFCGVEIAAIVALLLSVNSALCQGQSDFAHRFIAQGKEIKSLDGAAYRATADGRIILGGDVDIPTSHQLPGVAWMACLRPDGQLDWSVRAPEEPEAASLFPLATDGDSIWAGGLRKDGLFRFGRFEAKSLRKEASIRLAFAPEKYSSPCLQLHSATDTDFDLQVSLVQPAGNSIRVALLSRDLRVLFDKIYTFSSVRNDKHFGEAGNAYLIRLPDRSGYYLCLRHPISAEGHTNPGVGILRLDTSGAIKWANTYPIGYSEFEVEPHMASDGAILVSFTTIPNSKDSLVLKIAPDGTINWAQRFPGLPAVSVANASFGSTPYRFIEPYLYATAGQLASTKLYSILLALNYRTGQIDKQVKLTSPGGALYTEKTNDSLYATLLNMNYAGGRVGSQAALLRFDFDLNLRAARSIRNAEPHWPILHALASGKLLSSYSYHDRKTLVVETVNENLDRTNSCEVLQKVNLSATKSNFEARPIKVETTPLASITVSDVNSQTGEADMALVPFELTVTACSPEHK